MAAKVIQLISPDIKLALPTNRRSAKGRKKTAANLAKEFRNLLENIPQNEITIDKYKEFVYSLISPQQPQIDIVQIKNNKLLGGIDTQISIDFYDNKYHLLHNKYKLLFNLDGNKILNDKNIIVHETRHLFDQICSPKYSRNTAVNHYDDTNFTDKFLQLHNSLVEKKITKEELQEQIKEIKKEDIIEFLQGLRHNLQTEKNAYQEEISYISQTIKNPLNKLIFWLSNRYQWKPLVNINNNLKIITKELISVFKNRNC